MTADLHDPNVLAAYIDGTLDQDERSPSWRISQDALSAGPAGGIRGKSPD